MKMEKFSLKWDEFQSTVSNSFKLLKQEKDFFDVTLVSDDQKQIQSHKIVLSACSSFFKPILQSNTHSHPLIYLSGIDFTNLKFIIDYIYEGEVQLFKEQLDSFLDAAQKLQIAGLLSVQEDEIDKEDIKSEQTQLGNGREFKNNFEISGINNQEQKLKHETVVDVSGHDHSEVNRKINEIFIQEEDNFKCNVCGKVSKDKRNIRRHVELHMEGLSYECQLCNNTFR